MLRIGDFSKLTHVSIRMLRHYDETGLLKPARIDHETGYRYYAAAQLLRLHRILALQDLGFSLKQIGHLLEQDLSTEQLRGMMLQKQAELEDRVRTEQERLARAMARLNQLETPDASYDILIREVPAQWVASVREHISAHTQIGYLFERLFASLPPTQGPPVTGVIWHDDSFVEGDIDAEALVTLPGPLAETPPGIQVYPLPAFTMATVIHQGTYLRLPQAYDALVRWLDVSGYRIAGPNREIYLHYTLPSRPDDETFITEIQFPIERVQSFP